MANAIYPKYKEALLSGATNVALDSETVKISLIDSDVTSYSSLDQFYSDLNEDGIIGTATLANTSVENGVFDADDISIVAGNTESEALLLWIDTANTETSRLVAWLDDSITGLPIIPNGSNVDITWNNSGIFKL